ncbi:MAG: prepilin-type N-terminal cleavage/methylation domain-containing protein [Solobacterium sp.]|nr:prepilin-type N-terminal cleavage/methylation domain-containing protein [Erysipelotrichaceae bacterium]MBQ1324497.1 prepilin-type N-terminal cleavage/methylation domain-containing protein [Solobacterium sp.]MBQ1382721.1 prepilin-type N-terminal cleavage/methylation domain-containing protein [Solobacterium sp.]MBQ1446563.1 prepilin-type N-terminal cleavage/methylation domain-containing protein [Solobacterium sp.]MBQ2689262.1 prepilin-type N-terminal cleavage/methylation domain-containing prot
MKKKEDGFTLLEMVIVVSIIAVLFLLTVPNIQKVLSVVNEKGCDAQVKVVDSAILQYRLEYDENPGSIADLINAGYLTSAQSACKDGRNITVSNGQASAG